MRQQAMKIAENLIQVSQLFNQSAESVWLAITSHKQMVQWFFNNIPDFQAKVGFKTQFDIENQGRHFLHLWEVIEVQENKRIVCNWKYQGYVGDFNVEFDISRNKNKTLLTVSCHVLQDFEDGIPEFSAESCRAGWQYFIQDSLKKYLDKT